MDYYSGINSSNDKIIRTYKNDSLQIELIKNTAKTELLTNCFNNGRHFGRQSLTITSHDFDGFDNFNHAEIVSVTYFGGKYFIKKPKKKVHRPSNDVIIMLGNSMKTYGLKPDHILKGLKDDNE